MDTADFPKSFDAHRAILGAEPRSRACLAAGRALLAELRDRLTRLPATEQDTTNLLIQFDSSMISFCWSSLASSTPERARFNALLGERVLEEGVTPTTAHIELVRYGDGLAREVDSSGIHVVGAPVALLRDLHIVDTPGTNAINRAHERLTVDFVPRADLVLFVASADRPFTETERLFSRAFETAARRSCWWSTKSTSSRMSAISRRSCSWSANPACVSSVSSRTYLPRKSSQLAALCHVADITAESRQTPEVVPLLSTVVQPIKVVGTAIMKGHFVAKDVICDHEDRVRDGNRRALRPSTFADAAIPSTR